MKHENYFHRIPSRIRLKLASCRVVNAAKGFIFAFSLLFTSHAVYGAQQLDSADVFPLGVGNEWTYSHSFEAVDLENGPYAWDSGRVTLTVVAVDSMPDTVEWHVVEKQYYVHTVSYPPSQQVIDTQLAFQLVELQSGRHQLIVKGRSLVLWFGTSPIIDRYQPVDSLGTSNIGWVDTGYLGNNNWDYLSNRLTFSAGVGITGASRDDAYRSGSWISRAALLSKTLLSPDSKRSEAKPSMFSLEQNFPNPFNPMTRISFSVPSQSHVKLIVFDILGREVTTLVNEEKPAGEYSVVWDAEEMSSGVYIYRMLARQIDGGQAGSFTATKKLLLLR